MTSGTYPWVFVTQTDIP